MNPLQQAIQSILVIMDDWRVVFVLAAIVLFTRVVWARALRNVPSPPPVAPAPPRHPAASLVQGIGVTVVVLIWGVVHLDWWIAVGAGAAAYFLPDLLFAQKPRDTTPDAKATRQAEPTPTPISGPPAGKHWSLEMLDVVLIALILVFGIVRPVMLQTFFIPSPSMEPTLMGPLDSQGRDISPAWQRLTGAWNYQATKYRQPKNLGGDKLIASKMLFRLRPPARGDVVVFTPPMEAVLGTSPHFTDPDTLAPINLYMVRVFLEQNPGVLSKDEISALADTALKMHPEIALARGARIESEADLIRLLPVPSQDDYIKRVIAVAGDRVRVVQDVGVFINGELQREAYVEAGVAPSAISFPRTIASPGPRPTLASTADASSPMMMASRREAFRRSFSFWLQSSIDGGWFAYQRQYAERILPNVRKTDQGDEFVVPSGHVFVMGDNRRDGSSYDSRFWGCVPVSSVKARAVATFWPLDRLKLL